MVDGDGKLDETLIVSLRADARHNRKKVLDAARRAFAADGFEASYHQIARLAGVGVGTVYRRYPDRARLVEAVLLDILDELANEAEISAEEDAWASFSRFFMHLSDRMYRHAGLSAQLGFSTGAMVDKARRRLVDAIDGLCRYAIDQSALRPGVGCEDVIFLAQAAGVDRCGLGVELTADRRAFATTIMLDGLKLAGTHKERR